MKKVYELWEARDELGGQYALLEKGTFHQHAAHFQGKPHLLKTFEARNYNEAAQMRNDFLGWEKYIPMDDAEDEE
ncbi:MAG: hypothetical protein JO067_15000 [Cupriavidus sp.]|nr:hypothetical protein [Cupriavidus sp.]